MSGSIDLKDLILKTVENYSRDNLYTSLPAEVISIENYSEQQTVDVRPLIRKLYKDGRALDAPAILDVPVILPHGGGAYLTFPVAIGDTVLLTFSMRSLEDWLNGDGSIKTPSSRRQFHITDAIAIPGLFTKNSNLSPDSENSIWRFNTAKIKLQPDDKIAIGAGETELLKLVSDLLQALIVATTATSLGPQPLSEVATFTQLKADLDAITGTL